MAYVFGINLPLNEMIFIIAVALLGCMVAVLIELKKLASILTKEKADLSRFEGDLQTFERDEKALKHPEKSTGADEKRLAQFRAAVKDSFSKGMSAEQIKTALASKGFSAEQAEQLIVEAGQKPAGTTPGQPRPGTPAQPVPGQPPQ